MITKTCECGVVFEYEPVVGFPDKRKYCDACKVRKKQEWDAKTNGNLGLTTPVNKPVSAQSEQQIPSKTLPATGNEVAQETGNFQSTVWNHNVRPHSSEIGRVGNRHKVYWETLKELNELIKGLVDAGYLSEEEVKAFKPEQ